MAASGFTPISLYHSTTAAAAPVNTNLVAGELAINVTDGKLFYKDNSNVVQVIGWKTVPATAGGTGLTAAGTVGNVLTSDGTTWTSAAPAAQVYPGAGIANSTGTAWGTSYTVSGTGTVVALQTTPVFIASRVTVSALGTLTTGTTTLDLATAQVYTATITAANTITLAFSNAPSAGQSQIVLLRLTDAGGGTIVYPANTKFSAGTAPVFTASGVDVIGIYYDVTTTTYMVFVIGLDVKVP
jgi:hypothetical protein